MSIHEATLVCKAELWTLVVSLAGLASVICKAFRGRCLGCSYSQASDPVGSFWLPITDVLWFIRENFVALQDPLVSDILSVHLAAGHEDHFWLMGQTPSQLTHLVSLAQADTFQVIRSWDRSLCHP